MKISFGLQNLLCEVDEFSMKPVSIRPGALELLKTLKDSNHELILWTRLKRSKIKPLKTYADDLFKFFDKIYCKEDLELEEDIPGCSPHEFKNINKIGADCMIECKTPYSLYSKNMGMEDKYLIVNNYREIYYQQLTPWQLKILGDDAYTKWEDLCKKKEEWIYDVLSFIDGLSARAKDTQ